MNQLTIDCDDCTQQGTRTCEDCVVTFICSRPERSALVVDVTERIALRNLSEVGLVPALHHVPRSG